MISTPDRRTASRLVHDAVEAGARQDRACEVLQLCPRTLRRWRAGLHGHDPDVVHVDRRPQALRPPPANKLSEAERAEIISICNQEEFSSLPPSQIVPILADEGRYIASEATFYRVLRAHGQQHHRGRARRRQHRPAPTSWEAKAPCQVWTWDITWLPGPIKGSFFYLYLILDIFSRKIVSWEVHETEKAELAAHVVQRAVWAEGGLRRPKVLHADNGSPMKGATMRTTLERLGIAASYSRPRVSNDNPFSEALFRTCKYRPDWPRSGFASRHDAQSWVNVFVHWYNEEHRHSAIHFVTPSSRHAGRDGETLHKRDLLYAAAKASNPRRWTGQTRNWKSIKSVWFNPDRPENGMKLNQTP